MCPPADVRRNDYDYENAWNLCSYTQFLIVLEGEFVRKCSTD